MRTGQREQNRVDRRKRCVEDVEALGDRSDDLPDRRKDVGDEIGSDCRIRAWRLLAGWIETARSGWSRAGRFEKRCTRGAGPPSSGLRLNGCPGDKRFA